MAKTNDLSRGTNLQQKILQRVEMGKIGQKSQKLTKKPENCLKEPKLTQTSRPIDGNQTNRENGTKIVGNRPKNEH